MFIQIMYGYMCMCGLSEHNYVKVYKLERRVGLSIHRDLVIIKYSPTSVVMELIIECLIEKLNN